MGRPIRDLNNAVNLSDKHLQAIGEVAVRWAEIEDSIKEIVWDLGNLREPGAWAVTAHINERMLVDIAKSLIDLLVKGPQPKLSEDMRDHLNFIIGEIYPKRNAMVHSTFGHPGKIGETEILPIRARGTLKIGPREQFSADDIFAIAQEILEANEKLWGFITTLKGLIPTWRHIAKRP
jgi:hypothetical protein